MCVDALALCRSPCSRLQTHGNLSHCDQQQNPCSSPSTDDRYDGWHQQIIFGGYVSAIFCAVWDWPKSNSHSFVFVWPGFAGSHCPSCWPIMFVRHCRLICARQWQTQMMHPNANDLWRQKRNVTKDTGDSWGWRAKNWKMKTNGEDLQANHSFDLYKNWTKYTPPIKVTNTHTHYLRHSTHAPNEEQRKICTYITMLTT